MFLMQTAGLTIMSFLNRNKCVRFRTSKNIIYNIPNRYDIIANGDFEKLWWRKCDLIEFKRDSMDEFISLRQAYPGLSRDEINLMLF
jgi:hypothetical protein